LRNALFFFVLLTAAFFIKNISIAATPDTVKAGVYITSIHDIDFKQKQYDISVWLWLRYKKREFDFLQNLEIPQAKSVTKSFSTVDSTDTVGHEIYLLMKLDCVMQDSWKINNFPFDRQKLRFSIENSQFDSKELVFVCDTFGKNFDPKYTLRGWTIDSPSVMVRKRSYETTFGDNTMKTAHSEYSAYVVTLGITRDAVGLFWKMFLGMYVALLIAYMCFFIHADGIDSRFGLSVGALFAVIGNKYVVDASLPESNSFTLVDTLHGITLIFILGVIVCNAISLSLVKNDKGGTAKRFDRISAVAFMFVYLALNIFFIFKAMHVGG